MPTRPREPTPHERYARAFSKLNARDAGAQDKRDALTAIGHSGFAGAVPVLALYAGEYREGLGKIARTQLVQLATRADLPRVREAIFSHASTHLSENSFGLMSELLQTLDTPESYQVLADHYETMPDWERRGILMRLGQGQNPNAFALLKTVLERDAEFREHRQFAAAALTTLDHPQALPTLALAMNDKDRVISNLADETLGSRMHPSVIPAFLTAAARVQYEDPGIDNHIVRSVINVFKRDHFWNAATQRYGEFKDDPRFATHPAVVAFGHLMPYLQPHSTPDSKPDFPVQAYDGMNAALQGALAPTKTNPNPQRALHIVFSHLQQKDGVLTEKPEIVYHAVRAAFDAKESKTLLKGGAALYFKQLRDKTHQLKMP